MGQPTLQKLISLPTFLLSIFLMYWSLPLCTLCGKLKLLDFTSARTDMYNWWVLTIFLSQVIMFKHMLSILA